MKDIGAVLRPLGFRGSSGTWRCIAASGAAVLNKQGSTRPYLPGRFFYVNTGLVPLPWWQWTMHRSSERSDPPPLTMVHEADGVPGLSPRLTHRNTPDGSVSDLWNFDRDSDLEQLRARLLPAVFRAGEQLVDLLEPGRALAELREEAAEAEADELGVWEALLVLEATEGESAEFDRALAHFQTSAARGGGGPWAEETVRYAMARVGSHRPR